MLNHKIYGAGDPIIILHGLFGMLDNWQTIAKKLAEDYMVILVDQRDHGKSPHTDEFNYTLLAEDLAGFMEENWIHHAHIIGHSMGGKTAMRFAADYPDMVDRLIIVDIGPKAYVPGHDNIFQALQAVPIDTATTREEVEAVLAEYIDEAGVRLFLMKNLQRNKPTSESERPEPAFRWKMNLDLLHRDYHNIIAGLDIKSPVELDTLFIYGLKSKYIEPEEEAEIQKVFSNASFVSIDSGHWIHAERPKELLAAVSNFLGR